MDLVQKRAASQMNPDSAFLRGRNAPITPDSAFLRGRNAPITWKSGNRDEEKGAFAVISHPPGAAPFLLWALFHMI
jgi:hypothetical protein